LDGVDDFGHLNFGNDIETVVGHMVVKAARGSVAERQQDLFSDLFDQSGEAAV
jgi:hypothetical protein